eukprot:18081-Heterococcus_DN1.PRE.2
MLLPTADASAESVLAAAALALQLLTHYAYMSYLLVAHCSHRSYTQSCATFLANGGLSFDATLAATEPSPTLEDGYYAAAVRTTAVVALRSDHSSSNMLAAAVGVSAVGEEE